MAENKKSKASTTSNQSSGQSSGGGFKFPTEVIDLPSAGRCYPEGSPLSSGKIEIKYMTAKEEDVLTSANLIQKGVVIDVLLNSLITTPGVDVNDLLIGDKNAVMMAARILAYGPEYKVEITDPDNRNQKTEHTFDLSQLEFKELPEDIDYTANRFEFTLPLSKNVIGFKLLTGNDEKVISDDLKALSKVGGGKEITTRLKASVTAVDGNEDRALINAFVENMLARDARAFRAELKRLQPDVDVTQEVLTEGGNTVTVTIPMTVGFFWPTD